MERMPQWCFFALVSVALAAFLVQMVYLLIVYRGIPRFRNNKKVARGTMPPPVSVIVVVRESSEFHITNYLPLLLNQKYHEFEVVVVDVSYSEDIRIMLAGMTPANPHMKTTIIRSDNHFKHGTKLALTVGIKAAKYEHMIMVTTESYPSSDKWLSTMAKGFISGSIVIGYCGVERLGGLVNGIIRSSRLSTGVRYLSAAIHGHPYRGIAHNIGYTKEIYFGNRGFNHLRLNIGDEDLFIQKVARNEKVSVVMNPHATTREQQIRGFDWWVGVRKYFSYAYRYYPSWVKWRTGADLVSRFVFLLAVITIAAVMPWQIGVMALGLWLIRLAVLEISIRRIGRRLGDRGLGFYYALYDLIAPVTEALLCVNRRVRPHAEIWK